MILENGFGTPKSKIVSEVVTCFCKNSKVCLKRLFGNVFSYMLVNFAAKALSRKDK